MDLLGNKKKSIMISIYYQLPVDAPLDAVWEVLVDKVNQPEKYVSGVESVEAEKLSDGRTLRTMLRNDLTVKEVIEVDEKKRLTRFELKDHKYYNGHIENTIFERDGDVILTYELQWEAHAGPEDFESTRAWFDQAVWGTKKAAEKMAASN